MGTIIDAHIPTQTIVRRGMHFHPTQLPSAVAKYYMVLAFAAQFRSLLLIPVAPSQMRITVRMDGTFQSTVDLTDAVKFLGAHGNQIGLKETPDQAVVSLPAGAVPLILFPTMNIGPEVIFLKIRIIY